VTDRRYVQVRTLRTLAALHDHVAAAGIHLPSGSIDALASPLDTVVGRAANRWAVLPMEGWDGSDEGQPTDLVRRRWQRFGESGATLIWGGEAVAVCPEGRANPHQLVISDGVGELRQILVDAHRARFGTAHDLVVGLQLTHSGRFSCVERRSAWHHPALDARWPASPMTDSDLETLTSRFVAAARIASAAGFDFVDVKACHGYLGHELLGAVDRPGPYGGDVAGRSRFLRETVSAIRDAVPGLAIGVRMSVFDAVPSPGVDIPCAPARPDVSDAIAVLRLASPDLICVTGGSPYYCPHVQRPAYFPPSDGYDPPEDPVVGVARLLSACADVTRAFPSTPVVASGLSYLQQWVGPVAAGVLEAGGATSVGLGRMMLAYHDLPADVMAGRPLDAHRLCRTFSDCTTAPRAGLVSGCWPLDPFYKQRPDRSVLASVKRAYRPDA
jgi:2,4-dienoyl-CoA reductase-like NADH-dependent reductase (Old Yellow Enzyme family)